MTAEVVYEILWINDNTRMFYTFVYIYYVHIINSNDKSQDSKHIY